MPGDGFVGQLIVGAGILALLAVVWAQELKRKRDVRERLGPHWHGRTERPDGDHKADALERWRELQDRDEDEQR